MITAIIGSRSVSDYMVLCKAVNSSGFKITEVVSGGATGVDTLADEWADQHGIPIKVFKPDYSKHGKAAPHVRNTEIVNYSEAVIAVWDGVSGGTKSVIDKATRLGKLVHVYTL